MPARKKLRSTTKSRLGNVSIGAGSTIDDSRSTKEFSRHNYKPGGVAQIIAPQWAHTVENKGEDP